MQYLRRTYLALAGAKTRQTRYSKNIYCKYKQIICCAPYSDLIYVVADAESKKSCT